MLGSLPVATIVKGALEESGGFTVVPFVRVASTDLNFPLSLALISVVMTQIYGVQALGAGYFGKFFNTRTLFNKPMFGAIDFGVGLLELVSEFSKVLSLASGCSATSSPGRCSCSSWAAWCQSSYRACS